jgi:hypothetical protein
VGGLAFGATAGCRFAAAIRVHGNLAVDEQQHSVLEDERHR